MTTERRSTRNVAVQRANLKDDSDSEDEEKEEPGTPTAAVKEPKEPKEKKKATTKPRRAPKAAVNEPPPEDDSLFGTVKYFPGSIPVATREWVERFLGNQEAALAELFEFILRCAGTDVPVLEQSVSEACEGGMDTLVQEVQQQVMAEGDRIDEDPFSSEGGNSSSEEFRKNFRDFWDRLVREAAAADILFESSDFVKHLTDFLVTFSTTGLRPFRFSGAACALQFASSLILQALAAKEERDTAQLQLDAAAKAQGQGRKGKAAAPAKTAELEAAVQAAHDKVAAVHEYVQALFMGVFTSRVRDVAGEVRVESLTALGDWLRAYPAHFLKSYYLKYLGWALNDRDGRVRLAALTVLESLYGEESNIALMADFTDRFSGRILSMVRDVDEPCCCAALRCAAKLRRAGAVDGERLGELMGLLVVAAPTLRAAVAAVVPPLLSGADGDGECATVSPREQLDKLITLLADTPSLTTTDPSSQSADPAAPGCHPTPLIHAGCVVDALWEAIPALRDFELMAGALGSEAEGEEDDAAAPRLECAARLLRVAACKAAGMAVAEGAAGAAGGKAKAPTKAQKDLPSLLLKFSSAPAVLTELLWAVPAMRLEDYALKGKEKQLVGLLHKLKDVFFRQSAPELLRACCAVLRHVSDDPSSATVRESAERVLREAADSLALKLKKLLPAAAKGKGDPFETELLLLRLKSLLLYGGATSGAGTIGVLLEAVEGDEALGPSGRKLGDGVLALAVECAYLEVLWKAVKLSDVEEASEEELELVSGLQRRVQGAAAALFAPGRGASLRRAAFGVLADMLLAFAETKTGQLSHAAIGMSLSDELMFNLFDFAEQGLPRHGTADLDFSTPAAQRVVAVARLTWLGLVSHPTRQRLSALVLAARSSSSRFMAEVFAETARSERGLSRDGVWAVFLEALKEGFSKYLEDEESTDVLQQLKEVAKKLSEMLSAKTSAKGAPDGSSAQAACERVARAGLKWAAEGQGAERAAFLGSALPPFVARMDPQGLDRLAAQIDTVSEDRDGEEWEPLRELSAKVAQAAKKKTKGGGSVGPSGVRRKKGGGSAAGDDDDEDAEQEGEEPSPSPSGRKAGAAAAKRSGAGGPTSGGKRLSFNKSPAGGGAAAGAGAGAGGGRKRKSAAATAAAAEADEIDEYQEPVGYQEQRGVEEEDEEEEELPLPLKKKPAAAAAAAAPRGGSGRNGGASGKAAPAAAAAPRKRGAGASKPAAAATPVAAGKGGWIPRRSAPAAAAPRASAPLRDSDDDGEDEVEVEAAEEIEEEAEEEEEEREPTPPPMKKAAAPKKRRAAAALYDDSDDETGAGGGSRGAAAAAAAEAAEEEELLQPIFARSSKRPRQA